MGSFLTGFILGGASGAVAVFYGGPVWDKVVAWLKTWRPR